MGAESLGCYWQDGECRGDGVFLPDAEACRATPWLATAWAYLQYVVVGLLMLGLGGGLWLGLLRASARGGGGGAGGLLGSFGSSSLSSSRGPADFQR